MATSTELCLYKSLSEIADSLASNRKGKTVNVLTVSRWIKRGCRDVAGRVIRLQARRYPDGWRVTERAVEEFFEQLTKNALESYAHLEPLNTTSPRGTAKLLAANVVRRAANAARNQETAAPTKRGRGRPPKNNAPVGS